MKCYHKLFSKQWAEHYNQWKNDRHGCNRKSLITCTLLIGLFLSALFRHIKPCQTDQSCKDIEHQDHHSDRASHPNTITDDRRSYPETDDITQRINLDSKAFFFFGTILFRPCDLPVKHITQSRNCQTKHGQIQMSVY